MAMTKARLLRALDDLAKAKAFDPEAQHGLAVEHLLNYLGDPDITAAFNAVPSL